MVNAVNFFQPGTDPAIDQNQILRQRALADMLMKQGTTPQQGQMVSGHYVAPGAASYVAQLANALSGAIVGNRADQKEREMGQALAASRQKDAAGIMAAMQGTPAVPAQNVPLNVPNDDEGNPLPPAGQTAAIPAQGPDNAKALAIALQSQDPTFRAMVPDMMKRQQDAAEFNQAMAAARGGAPGGAPSGPPAGGAPDASMPGAGPALGGGAPPVAGANTFNLNPAAFALSSSVNPRAQALGKMIQEANKPQILAEGGTLLGGDNKPLYIAPKTEPGIQINNGVAGPVPGYGAAKAGMEGQIATAKDDNVLTTHDVGGVPTTKTNAEWRQYYGGGQQAPRAAPPQAPQGPVPPPQAGPARGNFVGAPEQVLDQINGLNVPEPVKAQMRQAYAAQTTGNNPAYAGPAELATPPGNMAPQGGMPPPMSAGAGRGTQGAPGIQGQSASDKEYATTRAKDYATFASGLQTSARAANGTLGNLSALEALYKDPDVAKGGAAENISSLKNLAASTGADVKGLGAEQAIQAITNKMALDARSTADGGGMPGAMSDADRTFLRSLTPNLSKTPEGRAQIIDAQRKTAQRNIEIARMANQYEQQNGRLDAGFDAQVAQYAASNPLFAGQKAAAPPSAPAFKIIKVH